MAISTLSSRTTGRRTVAISITMRGWRFWKSGRRGISQSSANALVTFTATICVSVRIASVARAIVRRAGATCSNRR